MLAITLSMFIVLGLLSVYSSGKKTYVVQEGLSRLQENGRYTTHYMNKIIRMAGYQGCVSSQNITLNNIVKNPTAVMSFDQAVNGYNASGTAWTPSLPTHLQALNIKQGTDVIEIWQTSDLGIRLLHDMPNETAAIVLADADGDGDLREGINQDDAFVITDCEVGDLAAAGGNANAASISVAASNNTTVNLTKAYTTTAKVLRLDYTAFYIKDTGRTNANGAIIYALVARNIDGNEFELADGVEDLQITYGIDTNGDGSADTYLNANDVNTSNNWDNVLTVRTAKLLNTIENVSPAPQDYTFEGTTVSPDDRLLRREWTNLISIRNRNFP
jgi:type IV pilus assembly protein PilW